MPFETAEIGWAGDPSKRFRQHEKYTNSVPLMNLMEALGRIYLSGPRHNAPLPYKEYKMQFFILFDVFDMLQASVAEHVISAMAGSYYWRSEFGFNTELGGTSVQSTYATDFVIWQKQAAKLKLKEIEQRIEIMVNRFRELRNRDMEEQKSLELDCDILTGRDQVIDLRRQILEARTETKKSEKSIEETLAELYGFDKEQIPLFEFMNNHVQELQASLDDRKQLENARMAFYRDLINKHGGKNSIRTLRGDWYEDYTP